MKFNFILSQNVLIVPLELKGRVVALYRDHLGDQYRIRFIRESEVCFDYFYAEELEVV